MNNVYDPFKNLIMLFYFNILSSGQYNKDKFNI